MKKAFAAAAFLIIITVILIVASISTKQEPFKRKDLPRGELIFLKGFISYAPAMLLDDEGLLDRLRSEYGININSSRAEFADLSENSNYYQRSDFIFFQSFSKEAQGYAMRGRGLRTLYRSRMRLIVHKEAAAVYEGGRLYGLSKAVEMAEEGGFSIEICKDEPYSSQLQGYLRTRVANFDDLMSEEVFSRKFKYAELFEGFMKGQSAVYCPITALHAFSNAHPGLYKEAADDIMVLNTPDRQMLYYNFIPLTDKGEELLFALKDKMLRDYISGKYKLSFVEK